MAPVLALLHLSRLTALIKNGVEDVEHAGDTDWALGPVCRRPSSKMSEI